MGTVKERFVGSGRHNQAIVSVWRLNLDAEQRVAATLGGAAVILALAVAGAVMLRDSGESRTAPVLPAATPAPAEELVAEGRCGACHGIQPADSESQAPNLSFAWDRAPDRLASPEYTGQAESPLGYVRESIVRHCAHAVADYDCSAAPEYGLWLSEAEVGVLAEWVRELDGGGRQGGG